MSKEYTGAITSLPSLRRQWAFTALILSALFLLLLTSACNIDPSLSYHPSILPVTFTLHSNGSIEVSAGSEALVTPIGTFSLGAGISSSPQPNDQQLLVVIQHKQGGNNVETTYMLDTAQDAVSVIADGHLELKIEQHTVTIDATRGTLSSILITRSRTASSSPSNGSSSTTTDTSNPYSSAQGTLVVDDTLSQPGAWTAQQDTDVGGQCFFADGGLHVSEANYPVIYGCDSHQSYSNFTIEVQMQIQQTECGGIIFRYSSNGDFYYWKLCQDGHYGFYFYTGHAHSDQHILTEGTATATNTGGGNTNTLAVTADGSILALYLNGQHLGTFTDDSFDQGTIQLAVGAFQAPAEVVYRSVRIWTW